MSKVIHHDDVVYQNISQADFNAAIYTSAADATINPMLRVLGRLPAASVSDFVSVIKKFVNPNQKFPDNKSLLLEAFKNFPAEVKRAFEDTTGKHIVDSMIRPYMSGLIALGILNIILFVFVYIMAMFVVPSWPWVAWWPLFAAASLLFFGVAVPVQLWANSGPMHTRESDFWGHYAKFCWSSFSIYLMGFIGMWVAYSNSTSKSSQFSSDITNEYQTQTGGMWQAELVTFLLVIVSLLSAVYQFIYAIEQCVFKLVFDAHPFSFIQKSDPSDSKSSRYNGCCAKPGAADNDLLLQNLPTNSRGAWGSV